VIILTKTKSKVSSKRIEVIDLFCGAGGLSRGLSDAGLKIVAGVDLDHDCEYAFSHNNDSQFICCDVSRVDCSELSKLYTTNSIRVLSGCAPCQPFSRYGRAAENRRSKWSLLMDFARVAESIGPDIITVENVPELAQHQVFSKFQNRLENAGYQLKYDFLYGPSFGIPQRRTRLVLIGSRLGTPCLPKLTHKRNVPTVRTAISKLRHLEAGGADAKDSLHRSCKLSELNLKRIAASKPGGTWRDWPKALRADCHKVASGGTYPAVYGRMVWDEPSPTITTQFFGFGNGRFGHPEQNRAISLREGAILQTFPHDYAFHDPDTPMSIQKIGQLIGNAVPVRLGFVIGKAIIDHVEKQRSL
jgi:DNA (cytosine-5)-methyltransferase 1